MSDKLTRAIALQDRGGHFCCADLQVHSPRDTQWDWVRPTLTEREIWTSKFITAAREKGLEAVAISDHHDFTFFPYAMRSVVFTIGDFE